MKVWSGCYLARLKMAFGRAHWPFATWMLQDMASCVTAEEKRLWLRPTWRCPVFMVDVNVVLWHATHVQQAYSPDVQMRLKQPTESARLVVTETLSAYKYSGIAADWKLSSDVRGVTLSEYDKLSTRETQTMAVRPLQTMQLVCTSHASTLHEICACV